MTEKKPVGRPKGEKKVKKTISFDRKSWYQALINDPNLHSSIRDFVYIKSKHIDEQR